MRVFLELPVLSETSSPALRVAGENADHAVGDLLERTGSAAHGVQPGQQSIRFVNMRGKRHPRHQSLIGRATPQSDSADRRRAALFAAPPQASHAIGVQIPFVFSGNSGPFRFDEPPYMLVHLGAD